MSFDFGPRHMDLANEVLETVLSELKDLDQAGAVLTVAWWSLIQRCAEVDRRDPKIVAREKSEQFLDQLAERFTINPAR